MLGTVNSSHSSGLFWLDDDEDEDNSDKIGAIRVLICGNTGTSVRQLIDTK